MADVDFGKNFEDAMTSMDRKIHRALSAVLMLIVNWIKENHEDLGGWINRTFALQNSISSTVLDYRPGEPITGIIYAGMNYAVYVEYMEGHWVLSGGLNEYRDKIIPMIEDFVKGQI
jgi:hypothetical protein